MSLLWRSVTAQVDHDDRPWEDLDDQDLYDAGVEEIGGISVAHPDDTPWHDEELMNTRRNEHTTMDPHSDSFQALQGWLEKGPLNHFHENPHELTKEPVHMIHDEDTGEHFLVDGHHRVAIARHHGAPAELPAIISHVSRKRM